MKFPKFSGKPKKHSLIIVRRVSGQSMTPTLQDGKIIIASNIFSGVKLNDIVVIKHNGIEKIKRIQNIRKNEVYVVGDNPAASTDSNDFGWLTLNSIVAKVLLK